MEIDKTYVSSHGAKYTELSMHRNITYNGMFRELNMDLFIVCCGM